MTWVPAADVGWGDRVDPRTRRHMVAFAVAVAFAVVVLGHFHDRFWWPPDEGVFAHVADRVLNGAVLHRDIQEIHFGAIAFANALALRLFGNELVAMRYPLVVLGVVQAALVFLVAAPRGAMVALVASVALTALSFVQFLNPSPHWYALFLIIAAIALLTWLPAKSRGRL